MEKKACLAQKQGITLKECLENRVSECILYPKCKQKRISLYVWDSEDEEADRFCEKLSEADAGDFLRLHGQKDFTEQLIEKLEEYRVKINNRELECSEGIYFLLIGHQNNIWEQFSYERLMQCAKSIFNSVVLEACRLNEEAGEEAQNMAESICSMEWRVDKEDIQTVRLLLQTAKYDKELFSTAVRADFQDSNCVSLKSTECNAVREDFSQRFLKGVRRQTQKGKEEEIEWKLKELFYPEKYKRKLKQEIPNPTWLPMVGAEELISQLEGEMKKRSFWEKMMCRLRKESFQSQFTIKEAMEILFGGNGYSTRTERLRRKIKTETMIKMCEEIVKNNKEDIQEAILTGFSLYDIIYTLQNTVLDLRSKSEKRAENIEEKIENVLDASFYYADTDMQSVYNGLEEYLSLFKDFIKKWLEYSWWNALAQYLQGLKSEVESDFEALHRAEIVLENSCIPFLEEKLSFVNEAGTEETIYTEKELRERIQSAVSNAEFGKADIMRAMKAVDKYFVKCNEKNVKAKRQPRIYMFVSSDSALEETDVKNLVDQKECAFQWEMMKSAYLPAKIIFQLRVYALE